jgi:soluble lytic murein transglycosylase
MGRDGLVLGETGWPMPLEPPVTALAAPVSLAIMRQESNFDATIVSPAGARGLMQLMPATAQLVAKRLGETTSPAALTADPAQNMRLGTAYLADMLEQFSALPLAVAAYNAGPHRVKSWLVLNGDPRPGASMPAEMVDWIELIPFNETRNYVQRVLENIAIYRVRRRETGAALLGEWAPRP